MENNTPEEKELRLLKAEEKITPTRETIHELAKSVSSTDHEYVYFRDGMTEGVRLTLNNFRQFFIEEIERSASRSNHREERTAKFGDYALIEQKRFGAPNEMYRYKVIGQFESNSYVDVPITAGKDKAYIHEDIVPVVAVICQGVDESEVIRVRLQDIQVVASAHQQGAEKERWVSIDEEKPEEGRAVNVHMKSGYITVAYIKSVGKPLRSWICFGSVFDVISEDDEVTHWQPLPSPPKPNQQ